MTTPRSLVIQLRRKSRKQSQSDYFASKRLQFNFPIQPSKFQLQPSHLPCLDPTLPQILPTLYRLSSLLYEAAPFCQFQPEQIPDYCIALTHTLIANILQPIQQKRIRLCALNVLINLTACPQCPNALLLPALLGAVRDANEQLVQAGWLISNILRKPIPQQCYEEVFHWVDKLLFVTDYAMLQSLFVGLRVLWGGITQEQYRPYLINHIDYSVRHVQPTCVPPMLKQVLKFIYLHLEEVYRHQNVFRGVVENCCRLMGSFSRDVQRSNCRILRKCIQQQHQDQYQDRKEWARTVLVQKHSQTLFINVCVQDVHTKILLMELVREVIETQPNTAQYFIRQGLENIMMSLIKIRNTQLIICCFHIAAILLHCNCEDFGKHFKQEIQKYIEEEGEIGRNAQMILYQYQK